MADETLNDTILEAGASENSLTPSGGTAGGDLKIKTIADIVAALGTMSNEDLNGFKASLVPPTPVGPGAASNLATIKSSSALKPVVKEDLQKIFAGEESLSESFIDSATTLFEAAVATRVIVEMEAVQEDFDNRLADITESQLTQFTERLDSYLDYVAERFLADNQIAVENGIRVELAESLVNGLANLFLEHNVTIPEDKVDVVAELESQITDLSTRLNEATATAADMSAQLEKREFADVVNTVAEGLVDSDRERFTTMAESISYSDTDDLKSKLTTVRDSMVSESVTPSVDNGLILEVVDENNGITEDLTAASAVIANNQMSRYSQAISAQVRSKR